MDGFIQLWIRGQKVGVDLFMPVLVGATVMILGNYLPKLKANWFFGIRTSWTLSSERSWRKTHQLGAWLFVACGAVIIVGARPRPGEQPSRPLRHAHAHSADDRRVFVLRVAKRSGQNGTQLERGRRERHAHMTRFIFAVLAAGGTLFGQTPQTLLLPKIGGPAPEFVFSAVVQGDTPLAGLTPQALGGRVLVLVLDFFATWCAPCVAAIPRTNALVTELENEPVSFLAVTTEARSILETFLVTHPMRATLVLDDQGKTYKNS